MSKLKVKLEVIEQLQKLIDSGYGYDDKIYLLQEHYKVLNSYGSEVWSKDEFPLLNELSFSDMYNLLHDNYEIEINAEDEIRNRYYYEINKLNNSKLNDANCYETRGIIIGIELVLHKLNREDIIDQYPTKEGKL